MNREAKIVRRPQSSPLDPEHLRSLAGELDVAGDGLTILARRAPSRRGAVPYLVRASACYGAAQLLRTIAE